MPAASDPARLNRRLRWRSLIVTCLAIAVVTAVVSTVLTFNTSDATALLPPAGFSAGQLVFDDHFSGTSLDSAHWSTAIGGPGVRVGTSPAFPPVIRELGPRYVRATSRPRRSASTTD